MPPHIRTYTLKQVNPLAIRREDIDIQDIAHALACTNRFGGHAAFPISVAQHSVFASWLVEIFLEHEVQKATRSIEEQRLLKLQATLHDAAEAYVGDMTKWVKESPPLAGFRAVEDAVQERCYDKFGIPRSLYDVGTMKHPLVEAADKFMVRFEFEHAYGGEVSIDHPAYPRITKAELAMFESWRPWGWQEAETAFLDRFEELQ